MTGLHVGGGIASVNRCIARALGEAVHAGRIASFDSVSLNDAPDAARPSERGEHAYAEGSQLGFALRVWKAIRRRPRPFVLFDHAGLARAMRLPLPGLRDCAYGVFAHGGELSVVTGGARRRAFEGADRVLTNSEFTAASVRERFPALADRVRAVPLCIDPDLVEGWERSGQGAESSRSAVILIVGRMWSEERGKGHDALLRALPAVRERVPEAELWVVGQGDDVPRLEALAREQGVEPCVRFLGGVSDEDLGRLYRSAGVFAMPSRQEGFGLVYAEAMWHGLPCIGSTRDAAREVIEEGRTGRLVPYDDPPALAEAIVAILSDREGAARMGRAAAEDARRRFGYDRFREDLLAALGVARGERSPLL